MVILTRKDITIAHKIPWRIRDALKALLFVIIVPVIYQLAMFGLAQLHILPTGLANLLIRDQFSSTVAITIVAIATELAMLWWIKQKYQLKLADFGLRKFSAWRAILMVVGFYLLVSVLVIAIFVLVKLAFPGFDANQAQDVGFEFGRSGPGLWFSFVATVIIAPIIEEVYFRGLILPVFVRRWGVLAGVLGSSLLFALLHFQPNAMIFTFLLGHGFSIANYRIQLASNAKAIRLLSICKNTPGTMLRKRIYM